MASKVNYNPKECPECHSTYKPRRHDQIFCSRACNDAGKNRAFARGQAIYREAYLWALDGGKEGRSLLTDISRAARAWVKEDKEAGRSPPPLPERIKTKRLNESYELRLEEMRRMMGS